MRYRLFALIGFAISVSGCTCTIDPESVAPPVACVATGCTGKACGYVDCGTTCNPGSGCVSTHSVRGGIVAGGGLTTSSAHSVQGELTPASGTTAATSGHSISQGTLSR